MNVLNTKTINYKARTYAIEKDPVKIFGKDFRLRIFYKNLKISELNSFKIDVYFDVIIGKIFIYLFKKRS